MELKPKLATGDFSTKAFNQDINKFGRVLDILNKNNKEEGEFTSEDLFSFLLNQGIENLPEIKAGLEKEGLGRKKTNRRSNKVKNLN